MNIWLSVDSFTKSDQIIRMVVPPLRIALLTSVSGVTFSECFSGREVTTIDGVQVSLINLEDLKRNKRAAGRDKDRNDLANLP